MNDDVRVVARIQHHPSRRDLIPGLTRAVAPLPVVVCPHSSDPPNPWKGYEQALEDGVNDSMNPTHVLVLQDDVQVCRNFALAVTRIARRNPDIPVSLFLAHDPRAVGRDLLLALKAGEPYFGYRVSKFVPAVAMLWPAQKAREFLEWTRSGVRLPGPVLSDKTIDVRSDDAVIGEWHRRTQQRILCTAPSLVEHDPQVVSTIGKPLGRKARLFIGADDPLAYEW